MNRGVLIMWSIFVGLMLGLLVIILDTGNHDASARNQKQIPCSLDIDCLDLKHHRYAQIACSKAIEEDLKTNYRWTNLKGKSILEHKRFNQRLDDIIVYTGNALEVQNSYGAWKRHSYTCFYNTRNATISDFGIFLD